MFNSTHTFVGFAIARTGLDKWVPYATVTSVIASNLPDIDIVTAATGTATYIDLHRGLTHCMLGIPVLALLLAAAMYYFSGNFWRTFVVALIAMAIHPLLDYANTYGMRPFLPFDGTWYYGDILYIIDPYIDAALLLGIIAGEMTTSRRKTMAWVSLVLAMAYVGARIELRQMAVSRLEEFLVRIPEVEKWAVSPTMLNPLEWEGVVQTRKEMLKLNLHALHGVDGEPARLNRGITSDIAGPAAKTKSGDVLLRFSRFPVVRVEGVRFGAAGYRVLLFDFRFYNETNNTALGSEVILDQSLHVVKESMSFGQLIN